MSEGLREQRNRLCKASFDESANADLVKFLQDRYAFQTDAVKRLHQKNSRDGESLSNDGLVICFLLAKWHYLQTGQTDWLEQLLQAKPALEMGEEDPNLERFYQWAEQFSAAHGAANLDNIKACIRADVSASDYYLPHDQRLSLAGLSFTDKVFTGAYLANTDLSRTKMLRVIWHGAVLRPARPMAGRLSGTTIDLHNIGTTFFSNSRRG